MGDLEASFAHNPTGNGFYSASFVNPTSLPALKITQAANTSASVSVGGAVNIDNSLNTGPALVIFSSQASPAGRLVVVNQTSATFNQAMVRLTNAGTSSAIDITASGTGQGVTITSSNTTPGNVTNHTIQATQQATSGTLSSAANFASSNPQASCVQMTGTESGRGTLKIAHEGQASVLDDQNAAGLSIDVRTVQGATAGDTNAQGIFVDATLGGTNGPLMDLRNFSNLIFKVRHATTSDRTAAAPLAVPILQMGATAIQITQGTGSPEGVVTAPTGSLYSRVGGGANTTLYVKETGVGNTGWVAK